MLIRYLVSSFIPFKVVSTSSQNKGTPFFSKFRFHSPPSISPLISSFFHPSIPPFFDTQHKDQTHGAGWLINNPRGRVNTVQLYLSAFAVCILSGRLVVKSCLWASPAAGPFPTPPESHGADACAVNVWPWWPTRLAPLLPMHTLQHCNLNILNSGLSPS